MFRQVVDLASLKSAVILRGEGGEVVDQFDSLEKTHFQFAAEIARIAKDPECEATFIEDVPYGISSQAQVKPVLKFQGVIMMASWKTIDRLYTVQPASWMKHFPGVQRVPKDIAKGMTKSQTDKWRIAKAEEYARELGYEAPDLLVRWIERHPDIKPLKKNTGDLEKSRSDYVSAFLMSEALRTYHVTDLPIQGIELAQI